MLKTAFLIFLYGLSILNAGAASKFAMIDYYAMDLAAKLAPYGSVSSDSKSFKIARAVLVAAEGEDAGIMKLLSKPTDADESAYRSLESKDTYEPNSSDIEMRGAAKEMISAAQAIVAGCDFKKDADRDVYFFNSTSGCSSDAAKDLRRLGFTSLAQINVNDQSSSNVVRFQINQSPDHLQDLGKILDELNKTISVRDFAAQFELPLSPVSIDTNFDGVLGYMGNGPNIRLDFRGAQTSASTMTVHLKYWEGSGDCPMGCTLIRTVDLQVQVSIANANPTVIAVNHLE